MVIERCPDCDFVNHLDDWDIKERGYKAFCSNCGAPLLLCSACELPRCVAQHGGCVLGDCVISSVRASRLSMLVKSEWECGTWEDICNLFGLEENHAIVLLSLEGIDYIDRKTE